jgi:hypothetical protein
MSNSTNLIKESLEVHIKFISFKRHVFLLTNIITNYFTYTDSEFSVVELENIRLRFGLNPNTIHFPDKLDKPLWNKDDFIKVMKAVVEAEDQGFILEDDLIRMIGYEKVHSLIKYNFLYPRLTDRFYNDIINPPPGEVILTAMNQPSLRAMERYLLNKV